ncbi:hypothetical protein QN379_01875 [Glaciimonas sp. Gout2]|uniref:hypothetical protein n=1 Tax=Glaciimonas sp. Gout2 TaxID=3048625 RepID=UPI002B22BB34|nr:hypothetical protein [Glaciimonas sp. Gout2]MEB0080764.1 hypothetical protein [Glaciimonas sp. Gout2]
MKIVSNLKRPALRILPLAIVMTFISNAAYADAGDLKWLHKPSTAATFTQFQDIVVDAQGDLYTGMSKLPRTDSAAPNAYGLLSFKGASNKFEQKWEHIYQLDSTGSHGKSFNNLLLKDDVIVAKKEDHTELLFIDRISGKIIQSTTLPADDIENVGVKRMRANAGALGMDERLYFNGCQAVTDTLAFHKLYSVGFDGHIKWQQQLDEVACTFEKGGIRLGYVPLSPIVGADGAVHISTQVTDSPLTEFGEGTVFKGHVHTFHPDRDQITAAGKELPVRLLQPVMGDHDIVYSLGYRQSNPDNPHLPPTADYKPGEYTLYAIYPDQSFKSLLSFKRAKAYIGYEGVAEPIIAGSRIYFPFDVKKKGEYYGAIAGLKLNAQGVGQGPIWIYQFKDNPDMSNATVAATPVVSQGKPEEGIPGTVYVASQDGLYALNAATGEPIWKKLGADYSGIKQLTLGLDGTLYAVYSRAIMAIEGDGTPLAKGPWPKTRGNLANTGQVLKSINEPIISRPWIKAGQINATSDLPIGSMVNVTATAPNAKPTSIDIILPSGSNTHYRWPKYVADQLNNTTQFRAGVQQKDGSFAPQYSQYLNVIWSQAKDAKVTVTVNPATDGAPTWKNASAITSTGDLKIGSNVRITLTDPEGHQTQKSFAVTKGANGHYEWPKHLADFINSEFVTLRAGEMIGKDKFTTLKSQYRNTLWVQPGYNAELTFNN